MQNNKQQGTSQMTAPQNTTKMVSDNKPEAKEVVKIKALRKIHIDGRDIEPGEEVEVSPELAEEFCKQIEGHYSFSGERNEENPPRHKYQKAELVKH